MRNNLSVAPYLTGIKVLVLDDRGKARGPQVATTDVKYPNSGAAHIIIPGAVFVVLRSQSWKRLGNIAA